MRLFYRMIIILLIALAGKPAAQYTPGYVESSQGLGLPALDGGRTELELADVNGDGNPDILSIGDHGSPYINTQEHGIMVWFGDGAGNWSVVQYGNFGYGGIAVGDVNNDGLLDVGYGMHHNYSGNDLGDQLIEVALGNGSGTVWTPWDDGLATNGESWGMFGCDFADVDRDGFLDIASNSFGAGSGVHVYRNNSDGTWTQTFGFLGGNSTEDIVFGDVNNDGAPDFAAGHQYGTVYLGDGTGGFVLADGNLPPAGILGLHGPDLGDVDNDGTDELSFCNNNGGVEVWKWSGGNVWAKISTGLPASGGFESTQIYDMNMDGLADVAAFGNGLVRIWSGDGSGNWTLMNSISLPSPGDFAAFRIDGDADHNGYPDIALVDEEGSWINYQNHLRFFKETSPADSLRIFPVAPGANRVWYVNSVRTFRWISEVPAGDTALVRLTAFINDTNNAAIPIADSLPNNGHFQWQVPDSLSSFAPVLIRFTVFTATDSASAVTQPGFFIQPVGGSRENPVTIPSGVKLRQNYPNPFNPTTRIDFKLNRTGFVRLEIFNLAGEKVKTLLRENLSAGAYSVVWRSRNESGEQVGSGVYFYRLKFGEFTLTRKMMLLR